MNLADIREDVRLELLETGSPNEWSTAEIDAYANEGIELIQALTEYRQKVSNIVPVVGQQDYTLPDDVLRLQRVTLKGEYLSQASQYELDRDEGNWRAAGNDAPIRWFQKQHGSISLYPKPEDAGTTMQFASLESGPLSADSVENVDDSSHAGWTSPTNVLLSDNSYATFSSIALTSDTLRITDFDFAIPSTATISGIKVEVEHKINGIPTVGFFRAQLVNGGTRFGDTQSLTFSTTEAYESLGGAGQLLGATLTPAIVNSTTFGVDIWVFAKGGFTVSIDHVRITVYYEAEVGIITGIFEADGTTPATDYSWQDEFATIIAIEDAGGGQVRFIASNDKDEDADPEQGLVCDYDVEEENLGLIYAALPDTLDAVGDEPKLPEHVHPAIPSYVLFRCFEREGPMQDLRLALNYWEDFKDWMEAVLILQGKRWPEFAKSLSPVAAYSQFERRLNEIGRSSLPAQALKAHYE